LLEGNQRLDDEGCDDSREKTQLESDEKINKYKRTWGTYEYEKCVKPTAPSVGLGLNGTFQG
jgi:hypothetical protein